MSHHGNPKSREASKTHIRDHGCRLLIPSLNFPGVVIDQSDLFFAHRTFKWQNNATNNAAVHWIIVGLARGTRAQKLIFDGEISAQVSNISSHLTNNKNVIVQKVHVPPDGRPELNRCQK